MSSQKPDDEDDTLIGCFLNGLGFLFLVTVVRWLIILAVQLLGWALPF